VFIITWQKQNNRYLPRGS